MSIAPGYVHISVRNANKVSRSGIPPFQHGSQASAHPEEQRHQPLHAVPSRPTAPMTAPTALIAGSGSTVRGVGQDNVAHGFVLYVGVDEETAAANGTSLAKLAQDIRAYVQSLVPPAQSYAAVAIAAADAPGTSLDVVRSTFGDPTVASRQRVDTRPHNLSDSRPAGVLIDLARREVHLDGETLNLTFKEFELLNYLVENGTRTVGREELLEGLWSNAEEVPNERTIDVHIRRLRSKLGRLANTVRTVRGEGYRFYEHPEVIVWAAPEYSI
ncbi:DNA-binding winged helix-turn-helix (wHTH) protein [Psychromicrobium silvestre]|uniref:DNA-binding winged helix-turn-helix (WHTH) protein n=2 Tax=Psychromicrobium silvestre TaxID=1645614 RepID=A0A7Y9LUE9_9MICC|nr:winged helix-turn-helix domain-containing protein [Psychromicrobium silvestre]NYE95814.1 DNA-binding winged helix-turn-helix (wHTH) protein [Psychromicrobium silvestre]